MDKYIPPYDITEEMLELTSEIMELLGELKNVNSSISSVISYGGIYLSIFTSKINYLYFNTIVTKSQ